MKTINKFLVVWFFPLLLGLPTDVVFAQELIQDQEALNEVSEEKLSDFYEALENIFPMTPEMVDKFLAAYFENEVAVSNRPEPNPLIDFQLVSLDPGGRTSGGSGNTRNSLSRRFF